MSLLLPTLSSLSSDIGLSADGGMVVKMIRHLEGLMMTVRLYVNKQQKLEDGGCASWTNAADLADWERVTCLICMTWFTLLSFHADICKAILFFSSSKLP